MSKVTIYKAVYAPENAQIDRKTPDLLKLRTKAWLD